MSLKLTRRHGSPFWYIRGTVRSVTVDESTKVTDEKQAEIIRAKREWEIISREIGGRRATATFLEATVSYLEANKESRFVQPLLNHFGTKPLSEIGQLEVEECAKRLYVGCSPATINRQVFTPVSAILRHAAARKLCEMPVFQQPKQPRGRVRWLTPAEAERLIAACVGRRKHLQPLIVFLLHTGARVSEALTLDWRDVDMNSRQVVFQKTKNGDRRGVPLNTRVVVALAAIKGRKGNVFRRPDGEPYEEKIDEGGQIKTAFRGACKKAKIKDFHPHDCRHTWATWHYAKNRDVGALMELGGWRSAQMVMRYAHVNVSNLAEKLERLGAGDGPGENPGSDDCEIVVSLTKIREKS